MDQVSIENSMDAIATQEVMVESMEGELRAQKGRVRRLKGGDAAKLAAAEARLRVMRRSIFEAEEKWVPAARNGDQDAIGKLKGAGFVRTAEKFNRGVQIES